MNIAEQIIQEVQKLSVAEQHQFLNLLRCGQVGARQSEIAGPTKLTDVKASIPSLGSKLAVFGRKMESIPSELPPDLAVNHDHYLRGLPKRS